jgi:hypothetical protein
MVWKFFVLGEHQNFNNRLQERVGSFDQQNILITCVGVCMRGCVYVWVCVCVGVCMCGCVYVWVCVCVGVLVICVLLFTVFLYCFVCVYFSFYAFV